MLEKYYRYKLNYRDYLVLLKFGSFYELVGEDALIMNKIFNYKLRKLSNTFKVGFPVNSLDLILEKLSKKCINHIVVNDDEINLCIVHDNNKYNEYMFDDKNVFFNYLRIEKIIKYLEDNFTSADITKKLELIESIIK